MDNDNTIDIDIRSNLQGTNTPLDLGNYVTNLIGAILTVAAIAAFGYLIFGGVSWITAGGEEKNLEQAKKRITNAIIGLAIVAVSWALFLILNHVFGIGIIGGSDNPASTTNTAVGVCPCAQTNMCAATDAVSRLHGPTDCYRCTASGWVRDTSITNCAQTITCSPCN